MDAGDAGEERVARVRDEVRAARERILGVLVEIDDLRLQQIPQARAEWQAAIGCWEQALLEAELAGRRARRRLALVQRQTNRGAPVDDAAIEAQLDHELAEWQEKVEQARVAYEQAMGRLASYGTMSPADGRELRTLYHTLMRRLHPDVCRVHDEHTEQLFSLAQAAYSRGDVALLRSLEVATQQLDGPDELDAVSDADSLETELELVEAEEAAARRQLEELRDCEDLRRRRLLADPEWVSARTAELRERVQAWNDVSAECRRREQLLGGGDDAR